MAPDETKITHVPCVSLVGQGAGKMVDALVSVVPNEGEVPTFTTIRSLSGLINNTHLSYGIDHNTISFWDNDVLRQKILSVKCPKIK
jgi:hypothetical protein